MTTIDTLTELENKALDCLCRQLAIWREDEPHYSCIDGADITSDIGFYNRLNGKVIPRVTEAEIIEGIFAKYGVIEVWGR